MLFSESLEKMAGAVRAAGGQVGRALRQFLPLHRLAPHLAVKEIFPLPLVPEKVPLRGHARARALKRRQSVGFLNLVIVLLNSL